MPLEIYTDGSCINNPGPGGWAAIIRHQDDIIEISGSSRNTTNNRMELEAIIWGLRVASFFIPPQKPIVYTDSAYIANCFAYKWYERWRQNGWRAANGKPVENQDLWSQLIEALARTGAEIKKISAHKGVCLNERANKLARDAARMNAFNA